MSNVGALLNGRALRVADGVYLERLDERQPVLEEHLRALAARLPSFGAQRARVRRFIALAAAAEPALRGLDDAALVADLQATCVAMRKQGFADPLLARAFAAVREGSRRTLGMRHHDVQLVGGWALLQGMIAEMETGEGKTLVATLAACTAAAAGAAVHVITVNDYLASRDAAQNLPLYGFFGLRVGVVGEGMTPAQRSAEYAAEVVYVSNKEIVFDYLKDRIATGGVPASQHRLRGLYRAGQNPELLLRGLHVAIVDEADSILVDEARTPLIISKTVPDEHGGELYHTGIALARQLVRGEHFELNEHREIWVTPAGEQKTVELTAALDGVWSSTLWRRELIEKALTALWCYERDQHYLLAEGKVQIVDEFSGRVMPDRAWERGLHQMIEAKEGCEISGQRMTLSRMTYQRFLGRYLLLCGMTGTAAEITPELRRVYDIAVFKVPTHVPSKRVRLPSRCWLTQEARWQAVAARAAELSAAGRAVLIGTRSVEASERLSRDFDARGIAHAVINARQDKAEADTVAEAGLPGRITIATNMAGRGTDIRPDPAVLALGGLHVILTEFHESARVDRQLFGRCARQGQPGTVEAYVSLDDELFIRFAPLLRAAMLPAARRCGSLSPRLLNLLVRHAQGVAERYNARIRLSTIKQDRKLQSLLAFSGTPS
ncbi:preprotein translocase subunit SecA [Massilia sp. Leaf139]|uniref:preprotein translocase subunit SecA n=1 Tax=Massilia sp. Leaf139 TaxID=1736272 RepID=UPI0006FF2552|nr:preprotein translocase subunit SecA [Massilia sp. Leaf139]KQQ94887.1 preprotein translocase subunit SecA [Massilia sp. Leaf139]